MSTALSPNPLRNPLPFHIYAIKLKTTTKIQKISAKRVESSQNPPSTNQQLNVSVLRFTLGIPGLDESNLPRWIGYGFGSLLLLNHFVDSNSTTPAQLRTEALGLSLAAFSVALPYIGKFLKGAALVDQITLPQDAEQIFVMSHDISDTRKEDLAWASYILLRNTNTIAVLISVRGELCVRGYWNTSADVSKDHLLDWFERQIGKTGLPEVKDTLYFPQSADFGVWKMLQEGTQSLLVQPILQVPKTGINVVEKIDGFIMLASSMSYAYSDKDRAWIRAVADKFRVDST